MSGPLYPNEPQAASYPSARFRNLAGWLSSINIVTVVGSVVLLIAEQRYDLIISPQLRSWWLQGLVIMATTNLMFGLANQIHDRRWRKVFFVNNCHLHIDRRAMDRAYQACRSDKQCRDIGSWKNFYRLVAETLDNAGSPTSQLAQLAHQSYCQHHRAPL